MGAPKRPRKGSLQIWPRKRAAKYLPRINWVNINSDKGLKGFICYKAGMTSVFVKDNTEHSMTKGKKITIPATIIECPPMKVFSVRLYKGGIPVTEILAENLDKELKRKLKLPKKRKHGKIEDYKGDFDDVKLICYSEAKKTELKKTPDLSEIGISGSKEDKIAFANDKIGKEIHVSDVFTNGQVIDFRGLTKGFGFSGPVKRFGITLKSHKSEKGVRRPGSLGPWHPARTTFRAPMGGQVGMFSRVSYNNKIVEMGKHDDKNAAKLKNIKNYGDVRTDYMMVQGSVQGPSKRQLVATFPIRSSKKQSKKKYEVLEIR